MRDESHVGLDAPAGLTDRTVTGMSEALENSR
jgi:hypothetical protein